jgi:hypothetical protein
MRVAYELGSGGSRWFVLIFHSFAYVFLGVAPLVQIGARTLLWAVDPTADALLEASVICLVGVLLFDVGLWLRHLRPLSGRRYIRQAQAGVEGGLAFHPERCKDSRGARSKHMADRALAFLVATALVSLALLWLRGGLGYVFASREQMAAALCPATPSGDLAECGVVTALIRVPPVILAVVALSLRGRGSKSFVRLAIAIGLVGLLFTANPVSTPRFWFGAATIGVLGVIAGPRVRSRVLIWLAIPALMILVFPALDFGREQGWSFDVTLNPDVLVQKQDFDAFQQVVNGVTYVDAFGTRDGMQTSSALLFFLPRSLWTDKAPATGTLVTASLGVTGNTNVSSPLWEEAYVDFGIVGVAVVLCGLGYLVGTLEAVASVSAVRTRGLATGASPFFVGYGVFLLRGSLLPAIGPLAVAVVLVWIVSRFRYDGPVRVLERGSLSS